MTHQDLFVAGVAIAVGVFSLWGALFNCDWHYQLHKASLIESRWGRQAARGFYVAMGLAMLALGMSLLLSARPVAAPALVTKPSPRR